MNQIKNLFKSIDIMAKSIVNKDFNLGRKFGFEEGVAFARQQQVKETDELSLKENKELNEFLINRDMELCYDNSINGFRVRKRNFGWRERGIKYTYEEFNK